VRNIAGLGFEGDKLMDAKRFDAIVSDTLEAVRQTLRLKGDEYARGDRFSNFRKIAGLMDITPEKAAYGLVSKHFVALGDFVSDLDAGRLQPAGRWDEKLLDVIAYMCILRAMIKERLEQSSTDRQQWYGGQGEAV